MEHITITVIGNGMVRLTPDKGYRLLDNRTGVTYSEAEVKETQVYWFEAVPVETSSDEVEE